MFDFILKPDFNTTKFDFEWLKRVFQSIFLNMTRDFNHFKKLGFYRVEAW